MATTRAPSGGVRAVTLLAAFPERLDGLAAALLGAGIGAVAHVLDVDLGGDPTADIPSLAVVALALLAAGTVRARRAR